MEEECIICLGSIERNSGNYRTDICPKCNYLIHLDCYEKYISHIGKEVCAVCNELVGHHTSTQQITPLQSPIDNVVQLIPIYPQRPRIARRPRTKALVIFLAIVGLFILIFFLF